MSVTRSDVEQEHGEVKAYNFFDIDGTYIQEDSGLETFVVAGECEPEDYGNIMSRKHAPGKDEPEKGRGNELMLTLQDLEEPKIAELQEAARNIETTPRQGIMAAVEGLSAHDNQVVAHSAGWHEPIDAITNGYFTDKIAGKFDGEDIEFNGRYQKPNNMQEYMLEMGVEEPLTDPNVYADFIGDSNTDSEAILYADATGGLGIAIGDTLEEAREVDQATVYFGDETGEHDLAAAVLYLHNTGDREMTESFVEEYGLDTSKGDAEPGELAYSHQREDYIQELIDGASSL